MKKFLLILFAIIIGINLNTQAEDFSAVYNGVTIYYDITSSTLPRTVAVTYRGSSEYSYSNEYLGVVSIPDSVLYNSNYYTVTSISEYAFYACGGLTSINIPNSVTSICDDAFYGCLGLTSINIPNSVTSIGDWAFYNCSGLTLITLPSDVTSIGNSAFQSCSGLTSITIPNSVTSIGNFAFQSCSGLTSINVDLNNIRYSSINGVLFNKVADTLIIYPMGKTGSYSIPNSVTSIGSFAFSNCSGLTSIIIPNSVTSIGDDAFWYCSGLTSINIPNSVTSISSGAFSRSGLTSITLPNFITSIGSQTFIGCSGLTSITIPNSVTSIGNGAFQSCIVLTSITLSDSITSIGNGAFQYCSGLTSITLPNSITSISDYAFYGCSGLTSITLPYFLTSIGNYAFRNCTSLNTVFFNAINCDTMGSSSCPVFMGCSNFRTLKIGDSVQSILNYTFKGCSSITSLISNSINPPIIQSNTFYGVSTSIPITVPCNSIQNYQSSNYWNNFINYRGIDDQVHTIYAEICNGETYNQFGFNENTTGFYTQNLQTTKGCDSIVHLNLILNPIYIDTIHAEICSNETYTQFGFNVNTTGFYTQSLQTIKGCDSIVNLSLIVNPTYLTNHFDTICKGQAYNNYGFNFTANTSQLYTQNLQTIKGCDSIVNLSLIVNPIYNDTIIAEICQVGVYNQYGFNENTTGFYTQNLQTTKGCDSIINLNLIVNPTYNDTITAVICNGETYNQFGFNVNTTGFYTQNLQTINGCDSIVNLSLIVNPIYNDTITAIICQGDTYSENGFSANTIGFYTQNLQTINGCDSIVNLSLTVTSPPNIELDMVTVDNNNNNVVIWNKDEVVNHYNIYREGNVAGQYDLIATVLFDSVSMFVDTNSNPTVKAYMYKISTTDTCLNESALSPFHKTMHLTIGQGMGNNWNLNWTPYVGANYSTYNIYRGINTLDSLQFLTTISSSNTSYTDINVPSGYVYYQIEIIIDTTQTKFGDNNSIRSNYATNNTNSINDISLDNITIKLYPNPTNNKSKLEVEGLKSEADIIVYDMVGRVIKSYKINPTNNELEIDVNEFAKGVYNIRIMNDSINQTKKLIVQ
ncbi:MAG: T9SS type A sorting domain-containing protein [Bacteroidia bacterium]|nr:T9SS type A sorting domain-containing protein [Bacteroidia bacterium]